MPLDDRSRRALERLVAERPAFHSVAGEPQVWNALPGTLALIGERVSAGDRTLETGAGASTVMFAAAGARHLAISPWADEHRRIVAWCEAQEIPTAELGFAAGPSDDVLPGLPADDVLDVAFIDGKHSFPHPVVDWHYVTRRLRVGGVLILDDIPIPAVAVVLGAMRADPAWRVLEYRDERCAALEKLADPPAGDNWSAQPFNRGFPDLSFLPAPRRGLLAARTGARRVASRLRGAARARR